MYDVREECRSSVKFLGFHSVSCPSIVIVKMVINAPVLAVVMSVRRHESGSYRLEVNGPALACYQDHHAATNSRQSWETGHLFVSRTYIYTIISLMQRVSAAKSLGVGQGIHCL